MNRIPFTDRDIEGLEPGIIQTFKDRYALSLLRWPSWYNADPANNYLREAYFCHATVIHYPDESIVVPMSVVGALGGSALAIADFALYFKVQAIALMGPGWTVGDLELLRAAGLTPRSALTYWSYVCSRVGRLVHAAFMPLESSNTMRHYAWTHLWNLFLRPRQLQKCVHNGTAERAHPTCIPHRLD